MVVYVCDCLNVTINAVAKGKEEETKGQHSCPLDGAVLVELGDEGFNFRLDALVKKEDKSSWKTFTCLNCRKDTLCFERTLHQEAAKLIYMNKDLKTFAPDGEDDLHLNFNPYFSPLYRIIMNPVNYLTRFDCRHLIDGYEDLEKRLKTLGNQSDRYMLEEELRIEDRVRRFELEQRERLDQIRARTKVDKDMAMSVLWKSYSKDELAAAPEDASEKPSARSATDKEECKCAKPTINPDYHCIPVPDVDRQEIFVVDDLDSCQWSGAADKLSNAGDDISSDSDHEEVPSYKQRNLKTEESFKAGGPWQDDSFCHMVTPLIRQFVGILLDSPSPH